jgi:hypothetical protein
MRAVAQGLEALGVRYAVVGSVAALSHGYGRNTIDIDVLAEMQEAHVDAFAAHLDDGSYFVDAHMIRDAIRHAGSFNLYHFETGIKVDIFVSRGRPFDQQVLLRREAESMRDSDTPTFFVQSAEDLVLSKLQWYRLGQGASDRQWSDILAILRVQQFAADFGYLDRWARELNISDLLEKALDEAGLNEKSE